MYCKLKLNNSESCFILSSKNTEINSLTYEIVRQVQDLVHRNVATNKSLIKDCGVANQNYEMKTHKLTLELKIASVYRFISARRGFF